MLVLRSAASAGSGRSVASSMPAPECLPTVSRYLRSARAACRAAARYAATSGWSSAIPSRNEISPESTRTSANTASRVVGLRLFAGPLTTSPATTVGVTRMVARSSASTSDAASHAAMSTPQASVGRKPICGRARRLRSHTPARCGPSTMHSATGTVKHQTNAGLRGSNVRNVT